jgi:hypothetical protein
MTNRAKARTATIYTLLKRYADDKDIHVQLSYGFIPESIKQEYDEVYEEKLIETKGQVDTDSDLAIFSNFFYLNDNKIIGSEKKGSGYMTPIKTIGDVSTLSAMAGVDDISIPDFSGKQKQQAKSKDEPKTETKGQKPENKKIYEEMKDKKINVPTATDIAVLSGLSRKEREQSSGNINDLISVEESIKLYSPNVTDAEIRGHVYHKQKHGNPMFGWEKWFIGDSTTMKKGEVCIATKSFHLLNQQFEKVKLVPVGAVLGVRTKFVNEYAGDVYVVIKDELNSLYYAKQSDFKEESSYSTVDQSDIDKVVMNRGLCYSGGEYVPVYLFTFGNIVEIKKRFYGTYDKENAKYVDGDKEVITGMYGKEIADWHESLIKTAALSVKNYDFGNPITSERPYLSKEHPLSGVVLVEEKSSSTTADKKNIISGKSVFTVGQEFYEEKPPILINELDINCGVSIAAFYKNIDSSKREKINYNENSRVPLFTAFAIWVMEYVTESMLTGTTKEDLFTMYFARVAQVDDDKVSKTFVDNDGQTVNKTTKQINAEKDEKKILAKIEGERLYSEFLANALTVTDRNILNFLFNESHSSQTKIDYSKVPIGFEANRNIFGKPFQLNIAQARALSFMSVNGSGCIAHTVGIGKTLSGIHNLAALLKQGAIKRPVVVVPKQVYNNWIYEMFGCWTDGAEKSETEFKGATFTAGALTGTKFKLNKWFNLRGKYQQQNEQVDENTITLITYQGLELIGFSRSLYRDLAEELFEVINCDAEKEDEFVNESSKTRGTKTDREREKDEERTKARLGNALMQTELDIDVCGFDYMVIDEAHNFKNIFSTFAIPQSSANSWRISNPATSNRGFKAFVLCTYLQKKYRNAVNLLTATPFTNSPFEVYSMMSLVAYNYLRESKLNSVFKFLSTFIETSVEYKVTAKNEIELDTVIKAYQNKNILRDMLYNFFDYVDNPEIAGVQRPCKINLPNSSVSTYLTMSMTQMRAQERIRKEAESYDPKTNRGAAGRALNWAKSNALSPWASKIEGIEDYEDWEELVNESPKLRYTIDCIKTVKDWHEARGQECSGQVIYSNRGKALFEDFKTALSVECGFKTNIKFADDTVDEVEIITGGSSDEDVDRKELVKDAFNAGIVKVIIGTATIQEGINLQRRGTVLYNLDLDWNPTAFTQLEGRIHRQQNTFKFVRIVIPMVQGTLDSFVNQKLSEKLERLRSIWDMTYASNKADYDDYVDPVEIKFQLITDVSQLLSMKLDIEKRKANKILTVAKDKAEAIKKIAENVSNFRYYEPFAMKEVFNTITAMNDYKAKINKLVDETLDMTVGTRTKVEELLAKIQESLDTYETFKTENDYRILDKLYKKSSRKHVAEGLKTKSGYPYDLRPSSYLCCMTSSRYGNMMAYYIAAKRSERAVLRAYGKTMFDDLSDLEKQFNDDIEVAGRALEYLHSDEYKAKVTSEIEAELEARQQLIGDISDRVEAFAATNYLLSYPFKKEDANNCVIPTVEYGEGVKEMTEVLEVDEYYDIDDISLKVTLKKLKKIKDYICDAQLEIVNQNPSGFIDPVNRLYKAIYEMPEIYGQDGVPLEDKMCYLHYFYGGSDWFIMEAPRVDLVDENKEIEDAVFGFVCLNDDTPNAELGYVDVNELKSLNIELDFYFEPKTLREAFPKKFVKQEEPAKEEPAKEEPKALTIDDLKARLTRTQKLLKMAKNLEDKDTEAMLTKRITRIEKLIKLA